MTDVPESDEVKAERERRETQEKLHEEQTKMEEEHQKGQRADHERRLAEARAFDWDTWEKETGLTRPDIPSE